MVQSWQCPSEELMARSGIDGTDFSFLNIIAYECKGQMAFARAASTNSMRGAQLASWKVLVSSDITESINHSWGKYESMSGKLQELVDQTAATVSSGTYIGSGALTGSQQSSTPQAQAGSIGQAGNSINSLLTAAAERGGLTSEQVKNTKLDASVIYQDSTNRQFNIEIELVAFSNPKREVYDPLRALMEYSCASAKGAFGIEFPAVFSLHSGTNGKGGVFSIELAALQAIQPTWKFPWKDGYPMAASATLTFMEIPPLYRQTMRGQSIVSSSADPGLVENQYRFKAQKG